MLAGIFTPKGPRSNFQAVVRIEKNQVAAFEVVETLGKILSS
jgi:hypothetical protein